MSRFSFCKYFLLQNGSCQFTHMRLSSSWSTPGRCQFEVWDKRLVYRLHGHLASQRLLSLHVNSEPFSSSGRGCHRLLRPLFCLPHQDDRVIIVPLEGRALWKSHHYTSENFLCRWNNAGDDKWYGSLTSLVVFFSFLVAFFKVKWWCPRSCNVTLLTVSPETRPPFSSAACFPPEL